MVVLALVRHFGSYIRNRTLKSYPLLHDGLGAGVAVGPVPRFNLGIEAVFVLGVYIGYTGHSNPGGLVTLGLVSACVTFPNHTFCDIGVGCGLVLDVGADGVLTVM